MSGNENKNQKETGLVLLELLLVVAIIGLMSSVVFISLKSAQFKARDARRVSDTRQLINILSDFEIGRGRFPCSGWQQSHEPNFLQFTVTNGYTAANFRDPVNNAEFHYSYVTFREVPTGTCGMIVLIEVNTESTATCPVNSLAYTYQHGHGTGTHCHLFYPRLLPPPCDNVTAYQAPETCITLIDSAIQY